MEGKSSDPLKDADKPAPSAISKGNPPVPFRRNVAEKQNKPHFSKAKFSGTVINILSFALGIISLITALVFGFFGGHSGTENLILVSLVLAVSLLLTFFLWALQIRKNDLLQAAATKLENEKKDLEELVEENEVERNELHEHINMLNESAIEELEKRLPKLMKDTRK